MVSIPNIVIDGLLASRFKKNAHRVAMALVGDAYIEGAKPDPATTETLSLRTGIDQRDVRRALTVLLAESVAFNVGTPARPKFRLNTDKLFWRRLADPETATLRVSRSVSTRKRFLVLQRDSFTCTYCGQKAPDVELQVDHVKPVSRGGSNEIDNLTTACVDCNQGKADMCL